MHEITRDFRLEDVWALPAEGSREEFPQLVAALSAQDPAGGSPAAARALMRIRVRLGALLGLDDPQTGVGAESPDAERAAARGRCGRDRPADARIARLPDRL